MWYVIALLSVVVFVQTAMVNALLFKLRNLQAEVRRNHDQYQKFADGFYWVRMPKNNDMAPFIPLASTGDVRKVMEPLHHLIKALGYEWVPGGTAYTMGKLVKVKK